MKLMCQCCGIEKEFADDEEAFQQGWDAPPHFSGYVCCDLCPAVCVVLGASHRLAHADWEKHGRPDRFSVVRCGTDETFGDPDLDAKLDKAAEELMKMMKVQ